MTDAVGSQTAEAPVAVVVLGAGTMGAGIALAFARFGSRVVLTSRREESLVRARDQIEASLGVLVRGSVGSGAADEVMARIITTTSFEEIDFGVDLVIESIVEAADQKRDILRRAEDRADLHTIVVTNTSSIPLGELSPALAHPEGFAGFHWFNPPELVELVEVVAGPQTAERTLNSLDRWSRAIGKVPVLIRRDVEGYVANRLQYALLREAYALVGDGICSIADVDRVVTAGLGPRWTAIGPFQSMDLAGLDVHHAVVQRLFPSLATDTRPPSLLSELVRSGALGAKSGRGLCGGYDRDAVQRLVQRRASLIQGVAALQHGGVAP